MIFLIVDKLAALDISNVRWKAMKRLEMIPSLENALFTLVLKTPKLYLPGNIAAGRLFQTLAVRIRDVE